MVGTNDEIITNNNIRDIVKQVKEGKINKTDAFNELRNMLIKKEENEIENIPPKRSYDNKFKQNENENEQEDQHQHHQEEDQEEEDDDDKNKYEIGIGTRIGEGNNNYYDNNFNSNINTPRFSKEDRRLLINKLIEKKRQDRNLQATSNGSVNGSINNNNNNNNQNFNQNNNGYIENNRYQNRYDRDDEIYEDDDGDDSDYQPEYPRTASNEDYERKISPSHSHGSRDLKDEFLSFREVNDASSISSSGIRSRGYNSLTGYNSQERRRPHSAGTLRSNSKSPSRKSPAFTRRSMDDSKISDYRNHKLAHQANIIHNEMFKECTFTPKVKPLPSSYGPPKDKDIQFYDRVMRWQREKEIESTRRKSLVAHNEVDGCTFHPKINRNSARAAKIIRGTNSRDPSSASKDTSIRLYESNAITQSQKTKFVEDEHQKELKLLKQECTFQPRLLTKRSNYSHVDPKYDKTKVPTVQELKEIPPPPPQDCTFTPKVKGVRNSMSSAKLYLKMNVVDRLSKPVGSNDPSQGLSSADEEQYFDDRGVIDVASFMGSNSGGYQTPTDRRRSSSATRDRRSSNGSNAGGKSVTEETDEEKEIRKQNFQAFLGRQSQTILRKDKKTEDIIRSSTPSFHPDVNPKSMKIVRQSRKGDFMDRVQQDVLRREQTTTKLTAKSVDSNHTFHPNISNRGAHMRSRSIYELSRGDLHKKETNQRILRLKTEQEELKNLTFQPTINHKKNIRSSLQLIDNPGGFLERYTIEQKQNEIERNKLLEEKALNELKDCTFAPQTKECPSYIKRIARSLSVVKAAKANDGQDHYFEKPQWK